MGSLSEGTLQREARDAQAGKKRWNKNNPKKKRSKKGKKARKSKGKKKARKGRRTNKKVGKGRNNRRNRPCWNNNKISQEPQKISLRQVLRRLKYLESKQWMYLSTLHNAQNPGDGNSSSTVCYHDNTI